MRFLATAGEVFPHEDNIPAIFPLIPGDIVYPENNKKTCPWSWSRWDEGLFHDYDSLQRYKSPEFIDPLLLAGFSSPIPAGYRPAGAVHRVHFPGPDMFVVVSTGILYNGVCRVKGIHPDHGVIVVYCKSDAPLEVVRKATGDSGVDGESVGDHRP